VPDEKALYRSDIVPTSYRATPWAEVQAGKSAAVWSPGPVGLLSCYWSKLKGARRVIAIDRCQSVCSAKSVIGCDIIDFSVQTNVVSAIYELEPQALCAIDATGFVALDDLVEKTHDQG
jgi:threonine dehydrogenase-like Zn-dependent dehydrogenase